MHEQRLCDPQRSSTFAGGAAVLFVLCRVGRLIVQQTFAQSRRCSAALCDPAHTLVISMALIASPCVRALSGSPPCAIKSRLTR